MRDGTDLRHGGDGTQPTGSAAAGRAHFAEIHLLAQHHPVEVKLKRVKKLGPRG